MNHKLDHMHISQIDLNRANKLDSIEMQTTRTLKKTKSIKNCKLKHLIALIKFLTKIHNNVIQMFEQSIS